MVACNHQLESLTQSQLLAISQLELCPQTLLGWQPTAMGGEIAARWSLDDKGDNGHSLSCFLAETMARVCTVRILLILVFIASYYH